MASIDDKISKVSNGTRPVSTTVTSSRSSGVTTLACADLTGWTTDTKVDFVTYEIDGQGNVVAGTQTDWKGIVSGSNINNLTVTGGTDNGNSVGDIVEILPTAQYAKDLADALLTSLDQDGTLKAGAVDNSAALAGGIVTNAKLSTTTGELGGTWQTWTPTITGFSSVPASGIYRWTRVGKTIKLSIHQPTNGTSNATGFTISLPVQAASVSGHTWGAVISQLVNGGSVPTTPGIAQIDSGATSIGLYTNSNGAGWTASGGKRIIGLVMEYEAA